MDYPYRSRVLDRLGVRSWINAMNWSTDIGATWIDDRVLSAMNEVAKTFVDMHELFAKADERVAKLCNVDDAHIVPGTGAAIELSVAGCMAEDDHGKWMRLPNTDGMKNEVVMSRVQHMVYAPQWSASGARLVEYGDAERQTKFQLETAISEKTCCLSYTISPGVSAKSMISLEEIIEVSKKRSLPVVVDSAAMLPPTSNVHKFTDMKADIACFSGGKAIKAPSNTGMMVGCGKGAEIISAVRRNSFPNMGWGRGHKISKEQIVGFLVALEIFLQEGDLLYAKQMETAQYLMSELSNIPGVEVDIIPNDESFHEHIYMSHVPRVRVQWDSYKIGLSAKQVDEAMAREDPPVFLRNMIYWNYYTNKDWRLIDTFYLRSGEEKIIAERMKRILTKKS